jgi:hypothetical protein
MFVLNEQRREAMKHVFCALCALLISTGVAEATSEREYIEIMRIISLKGKRIGEARQWSQGDTLYTMGGGELSITTPVPLCSRGTQQVVVTLTDTNLDGIVDNVVYNVAGFRCRGEDSERLSISPQEAQDIFDAGLLRFVPFSPLFTQK